MGFIPIFLQVEGKSCLVIGGGEVAARKAGPLLDAGASVTVISPQVTAVVAGLAESGRISLLQRAYRAGDMEGFYLVYAATGDRELQRRLFEEAGRLNIPINVADAPDFCSFIAPSVIRRGRLQVAISTGGASPAVARRLRQRIERTLGDDVDALLEVMAGARAWLKHHEPDGEERARKLNMLVDSGVDDALRRRDAAAVESIVGQCLNSEVRLADLGLEPSFIGNGSVRQGG